MEFKTVYPQLCDNEDGCLAVAEYLFTDVEKKGNGKVETIKLGYACIECFEEVKQQLYDGMTSFGHLIKKEKKDG